MQSNRTILHAVSSAGANSYSYDSGLMTVMTVGVALGTLGVQENSLATDCTLR